MKKTRFILFLALFNIAFLYVLFELGIRYIGIHLLASGQYITQTMEKIEAAGLSIEEFAKQRYTVPNERELVYDREIGWDRKVKSPIPCATPACGKRYRVLVLGDSVTQGFGVQPGEEWAAIMANMARDRIEIVNAGVDGYGMYQMYLKAVRELKKAPADLIIFTYIDHDIMRPAAPYLWGLTQPEYQLGEDGATIIPPEPMRDFIESYDSARSGFHSGVWAAWRFYEKRRYYFPVLYGDYFNRVQTDILTRIRDLSRARNVPVVLLRLPQPEPFRGRQLLREAMDNAWAKIAAPEKRLSRPDIGPCVRDGLKQQGIELGPALSLTHPGAPVHARYGYCVFKQVVEPRAGG